MLKKKFWIAIALMIVGSLGLGAEKYFSVQTRTRLGGDAFIQCLTRLDRPVDNRIDLEQRKIFVSSPMELYRFLDVASDRFDFEKFNGNWRALTELEKVLWFGEHINVESFEHGIYVFSFRVGAAEPHDYDYVAANAPRLLDDFVGFARAECVKAGVGELVAIERAALIPQSITVTRRQLVFKYMIVGAVLGAIAGLIVIFGLSMRRAGNV